MGISVPKTYHWQAKGTPTMTSATATLTTAHETVVNTAFVTVAFAWGFSDGATGQDLQASDFYTHSDARWSEFVQGFIHGAQRMGYIQAASAAASLLR
jgi:hypothetical protein